MKRRPAEFHYYDWAFNRWFGSETRARCHALKGDYPEGLLANAAKGIYRDLLDYCAKDGDIPADMEGLAALGGCSVEVIELIWPTIRGKFHAHRRKPGRLVNDEVDIRRRAFVQKRKQTSHAGATSAQKRGKVKPSSNNDFDNDRSTTVQRPLNEEERREEKRREEKKQYKSVAVGESSTPPASDPFDRPAAQGVSPGTVNQRLVDVAQLLTDFMGARPDDAIVIRVERGLLGAPLEELNDFLLTLDPDKFRRRKRNAWPYLAGAIEREFSSIARQYAVIDAPEETAVH